MPHHAERLAEMIREELTEMVEGELADPRIGLAAVTNVTLPPPARVARVFVTVAGDDAEQKRTLAGLMAATGFLRSELTSRLQLRRVPELRFYLDQSVDATARLEQLLSRAQKREAAAERRASATIGELHPDETQSPSRASGAQEN